MFFWTQESLAFHKSLHSPGGPSHHRQPQDVSKFGSFHLAIGEFATSIFVRIMGEKKTCLLRTHLQVEINV